MNKNTVQEIELCDDVMLISPSRIETQKGFNVRQDFGSKQETLDTAKSIVETGLQVPLICYKKDGAYILTDGECRMRAINLAIKLNKEKHPDFKDISKINKVRVIIGSSDPKERLYTMATTGERRKSYTESERANLYNRLMKIGSTEGRKPSEVIKEIMDKTGVSQASVYNILKLKELPKIVQDKIKGGEISSNTVHHIARSVKKSAKVEAAANGKEVKAEVVDKKIEEAVIQTVKNNEKEAKKNNTETKKATISHIQDTNISSQTPFQRIKDLLEELSIENVTTREANHFRAVIKAIEAKTPTKHLIKMFKHN